MAGYTEWTWLAVVFLIPLKTVHPSQSEKGAQRKALSANSQKYFRVGNGHILLETVEIAAPGYKENR